MDGGMVRGKEKISIENGSFTKLYCLLSLKIITPFFVDTPFCLLEAKPLTKETNPPSLTSDIFLPALSYV